MSGPFSAGWENGRGRMRLEASASRREKADRVVLHRRTKGQLPIGSGEQADL